MFKIKRYYGFNAMVLVLLLIWILQYNIIVILEKLLFECKI